MTVQNSPVVVYTSGTCMNETCEIIAIKFQIRVGMRKKLVKECGWLTM